MTYRSMAGSQVDERAAVGDGTTVWELAQIREHAVVGRDCVIGRGAYVGPGVRMGNRVKVQNHALVYEPALLGDGVFVGPAVVLTNDRAPRSVAPDGGLKRAGDWEPVGVTVAEGASLGARSVCVAPVRIGRWAMVAAGAVVTADVPDFALVAGVPARRIGWVGHAGARLRERAGQRGLWQCPETGVTYSETPLGLVDASPEPAPAPAQAAQAATRVGRTAPPPPEAPPTPPVLDAPGAPGA